MIGSRTPFSPKTVAWLVAVGLAAGLVMAGTSLFIGDGNYSVTPGANGFSRSALGHKAFIEALKASNRTVTVSQFGSDEKALDADLLMLLEPQPAYIPKAEMDSLLEAPRILVVLPKRIGFPGPTNPAWIAFRDILAPKTVERVLNTVVEDAEVVRVDDKKAKDLSWKFDTGWDLKPDLQDLQLVKSDKIRPLVSVDDGVLLGVIDGDGADDATIWILSDPDLIETHGLADKTNASFVDLMMTVLAPPDGRVVVDETIHGFKLDPSLARTALRPPFLFVTIVVVIAFTAFMMTATRRFGPIQRPAAVIRDGKAVFVSIMASLLSGHNRHLVRRYVERAVRDVGDGLHAPKALTGHSLIAWLDDLAARKGLSPDLRARNFDLRIDATGTGAKLDAINVHLRLAADVHRWKQEMLRAGE